MRSTYPCQLMILICMVLQPLFVKAQGVNIDSLVHEAEITSNDTIKLVRLKTIARTYAELNPDSAFRYADVSLALARRLHLRLDEGDAIREMAYAYLNKGNYPRSLQTFLSAFTILEDPKTEQNVLVGKFPGDDAIMYRTALPRQQRLNSIAFAEQNIGILYANANDYEKAWYHHLVARQMAEQSGNIVVEAIVNQTITRIYLNLKKNDSALISIQRAYDLVMRSGYRRYLGSVLLNMGRTYAALGNISLANEYYRRSLIASAEFGYFRGIVASNLLLAEYYTRIDKKDSAFLHIKDGLSTALYLDAPDLLLRSYTALGQYYQSAGNSDSIVKYQALIIKIKDSLFNDKQGQQFQNIDFDEQQRKQQVEAAKTAYKNKMTQYALIAGLGVFLLIAFILYRNNRQKQKANKVLEATLIDLKNTQAQLIQSEKMASLGQLTAGIAHEIQNPLNFVNNFSDISDELLDEAKAELERGNKENANAIVDNVKQNLEKILYHGKRADAIVKGMLQHSRTSTGQKEATDINALSDEYLRLAYHGMRVKDKNFNVEIKTAFDNSLGKINIVPQDIGRVLLNLINNGFYAVNEKQKQNPSGYQPEVTLTTKKDNGRVEIEVKDNGNGIPQKILNKIFQPFFTTKPTGQGTGLGLSLSYDIIKVHGGEIKVETREGEGTAFTVQLPTSGIQ